MNAPVAPPPLDPPRGPGPQRGRGESAFLPAALEILETPPSPARMFILLTICAFFAVALGWSWIGRLDVIATAKGKIHPSERVKVIEPLETAKVVAIKARDGQLVRAGAVLIALDARAASADVKSYSQALQSFEAEAARRRAALDLARAGDIDNSKPAIDWRGEIDETTKRLEERVLEEDLGSLSSAIAALHAQAEEKRADAAGLRQTIIAQRELVATDRTRVEMKALLLKKGAGSKADLINATETLQRQQAILTQDVGELAQANAARTVIERQAAQTLQQFRDDNEKKIEAAERQADDLRQKLAKARVYLAHMVLRSPIDGVVQGLVVTTVGQVVTPGEETMWIVPSKSELDIEAFLPNRERAFVKPGEKAVVKLASFPFTRYGTLDGEVVKVAQDAIPESSAMIAEGDSTKPPSASSVGGGQPTQNLVYPITVKLLRKMMFVDGRAVAVSPGMSATVEIRTGSRRILQYLFSPLIKTMSKSMRER